MKKGLFITLEGGEGAGKSTSLAYLKNELEQSGLDVLVTREPGGTELGERVRDILLHAHDLHITSNTELLLMFAVRAQHLETVIEPAMAQGKIVLCDRFTDATYAYQGAGRGLSDDRIAAIEQWVQRGKQPDFTLLFDLPVEMGLQRAVQRSGPDRFEQEEKEFFEKVRAKYLERAKNDPKRFRKIDASLTIPEVEKQLEKIISEVRELTQP